MNIPKNKVIIKNIIINLFLIVMITLIFGEIWFRLPCNPPLLDYEYDDTLLFKLKPNQKGCILQGGGGLVSPPITINNDGFRNDPVNWTYPSILCLGSSEVLGSGVKDNECWTSILQKRLLPFFDGKISVINAGNVGYGPYHAMNVLKSFINKKRPNMVIFRLSTGDKDFQKPTESILYKKRPEKDLNKKIKKVSRFIPFLLLKMEAQQKRIENMLLNNKNVPGTLLNQYEIESAAEDMWNNNGVYIHEIGNICHKLSVPLIFVVYDPIETPASIKLVNILKKNMADCPTCSIVFFGSNIFGMDQLPIAQRKEITIKTLRIPYDPHANALQHHIVGEALGNIIINNYVFTINGTNH
jgi:hypothetical protein